MKKAIKKITEEQKRSQRAIWFEAVKGNNIEIIQRMISEGFDIETRQNDTPNGWTALHSSCYYGHFDTIKLLLDNGSDVNIQTNEYLRTPLHIACNYGDIEIAKLLINNGADVTIKDKKGNIPLDDLKSFEQKYEELIEWLSENHPEKALEAMAHENTQSNGVEI